MVTVSGSVGAIWPRKRSQRTMLGTICLGLFELRLQNFFENTTSYEAPFESQQSWTSLLISLIFSILCFRVANVLGTTFVQLRYKKVE